jgi:asparagine N-glycosylation enzyme membrane subunit Stt3
MKSLKTTSETNPVARRWLLSARSMLILLVLALFCYYPYSGVRQTIFEDNDCIYHLHRVSLCLKTFPQVLELDRFSHFPEGFRCHWSAPYTFLLASLAKLAVSSEADLAHLGGALSWIPPLAFLGALCLVLRLSARVRRDALFLVSCGVAVIVSKDIFVIFRYGCIDHHYCVALGLLALGIGFLERRLSFWIMGVLSLLILSPDGPLYVTLLVGLSCAAPLLALLSRGEENDVRMSFKWLLAPAWACGLSLIWKASLTPDLATWTAFTWDRLSLLHLFWFVFLGLALPTTWLGIRHVRRRFGTAWGWGALLAAICLLAICGAGLLWGFGVLSPVIKRLAFGRRLPVLEEMAPWRMVFSDGWIKILLLAALFWATRFLQKIFQSKSFEKGDTQEADNALLLSTMLLVSVLEFRHLRVLAPIAVPAVIAAAFEVVRLLRGVRLFDKGLRRQVPLVAMLLILFQPLVWRSATGIMFRSGSKQQQQVIVEDLANWFKSETPLPGGTARHDTQPDYGVFCPWTMGHQIHVLGERPVVIDPFNHVGIVQPSLDIWLATSKEQLQAALEKYQVRYLVLCRAETEILLTFALQQPDITDLVAQSPQSSTGVVYLPKMRNYVLFSLLFSGGKSGLEGCLRPVYLSRQERPLAVVDPRTGAIAEMSIPVAQVYEVIGTKRAIVETSREMSLRSDRL